MRAEQKITDHYWFPIPSRLGEALARGLRVPFGKYSLIASYPGPLPKRSLRTLLLLAISPAAYMTALFPLRSPEFLMDRDQVFLNFLDMVGYNLRKSLRQGFEL